MNESDAIITIDGPSGSGKTTLGRLLADHLDGGMMDTGSYFRMTALLLADVDCPDDELPDVACQKAAVVADGFTPNLSTGIDQIGVLDRVFTDHDLRSPDATKHLSLVASLPGVRALLLPAMRREAAQFIASGAPLVTIGRDCGTTIWPGATCKFFMDAPLSARERRRQEQFPGLWDDLARRDRADATRAASPLRRAPDAIFLDSGGMSPEELLETAMRHLTSMRSLAAVGIDI